VDRVAILGEPVGDPLISATCRAGRADHAAERGRGPGLEVRRSR
jgi:hypothetical protein